MSKDPTFHSLKPGNKATITCPIFGVEAKLSQCFKLREMVWRGNRPEQRVGCQCAMRASKCPINHMIDAMFRGQEDTYFSAEPKHVAISLDVQKRIAPIQVSPRLLDAYPMSDVERNLLLKSSENAGANYRKLMGKAELEEVPTKAKRAAAPKGPAPEPKTSSLKAAESGDLGAALNVKGKAA